MSLELNRVNTGLKLARFRGYFPLGGESPPMARKHRSYPLEFRLKIIELARSGRRLDDLASEFKLAP
jgi:hypothetical protein